MTKLAIAYFCLTILDCSCNNQPTENKTISNNKSIEQDTTIFKGFHGTWVRQNKHGFTLIEIKDSSNVLYYQVSGRQADADTIKSDRFWYYKSKATMGYWDKNSIWISTDKFKSEHFVLSNIDNEFSFTSIPNSNTDNKHFTDLAEIGDTVIKSQFSDTLTLIKKQTKKSYKFGFVRQ